MKKYKALTLIEMLIIIAIIGILFSLLFPALNKSRRTAKKVACASNLRQIGIAINGYTLDNQRTLPGPMYLSGKPRYKKSQTNFLPNFIWPYTQSPEPADSYQFFPLLSCPGFSKSASGVNAQNSLMYITTGKNSDPAYSKRYFAYPNSNDERPKRMATVEDPSNEEALSEVDNESDLTTYTNDQPIKRTHGPKRNYLFFDFSVRPQLIEPSEER